MKKNGFTLVELITTFALTSVIIILLINVVTIIKSLYSNSNIKTELYINQSNLSNVLNSKINRDNLDSYEECDDTDFCYTFNFINGESTKLTVSERTIKFGDYVYNLNDNTKVDLEKFTLNGVNGIDAFLVLKIPITCDLYPDIDFGINLVYLY